MLGNKKILGFRRSVLPSFAINLAMSLGVVSFFNVDMVNCSEVDNSLSNTEISDNYVEFWSKEAEKLDWFQKWTVTEEKGFPFVKWFKNGKLNLAGAMGKRTFAMFHYHYEFRWYDLTGNDTGWFKSAKPFVNDENNDWDLNMDKEIEEINRIKN